MYGNIPEMLKSSWEGTKRDKWFRFGQNAPDFQEPPAPNSYVPMRPFDPPLISAFQPSKLCSPMPYGRAPGPSPTIYGNPVAPHPILETLLELDERSTQTPKERPPSPRLQDGTISPINENDTVPFAHVRFQQPNLAELDGNPNERPPSPWLQEGTMPPINENDTVPFAHVKNTEIGESWPHSDLETSRGFYEQNSTGPANGSSSTGHQMKIGTSLVVPPVSHDLAQSPLDNFGEISAGPVSSAIPPVESKFSTEKEAENTSHYDTSKPTCTLNLVCYRSGTRGCKLQQLQTAKASNFPHEIEFQKTKAQIPGLIVNDRQFFKALREAYLGKMCSFWRRAIFLKSLRGIRLLSITPTTRPTIVPLDDFIIQEILYAYQNPSTIETDHDWIDWVFRLRQSDRRHALEFVEGWNGTRIAFAGLIPLLISCVLGTVWSWKTGDAQTAFTVAGFVLTAGTLLLALLAIISGIEASGRAST